MAVTRTKTQQAKTVKQPYVYATGRRREAVARVRLYDPSKGKIELKGQEYQKGDVVVNEMPFGSYFNFISYTPYFKNFFDKTGALEKFFFSVKVVGGGKKGQLEAMIHGLARVLEKYDAPAYRAMLKEEGYLTRDARTRERRKVGTGGKARRQKQSPKR
jgi:small subunit ribosomal protein S9